MRCSVSRPSCSLPIFVPTLILSRAGHRVANSLRLGMNVAAGRTEIAVAGEVGQRIWVHVLGPPRQAGVPECVEGKDSSLASRYALGCCCFNVDFSIWPLAVPAGNTQSSLCLARRISIRAAARSVSGIVRRALTVLPNGTGSDSFRTFSRRSLKHSSGLTPQSIRIVATSLNMKGSSGSINRSDLRTALIPLRAA